MAHWRARRHDRAASSRCSAVSSTGFAKPDVPYELLVGLRYTRARRGSGRNGFVSFIAAVAMLGIALGVAALIVVLSVMNGFQGELTTRILTGASHVRVRRRAGGCAGCP